MKLRKLEEKDAPLMLEWMHDENVLVGLQREKFIHKTMEDCIEFINCSKYDKDNVHLAIVDEKDVYMGTVSLKNINFRRHDAEFAITVRSCAMGKGFSKYGMQEIIKYAFEYLNLKNVYWNVLANNHKAISFYNKLGYNQIEDISQEILDEHSLLLDANKKFLWYSTNVNVKTN